MPAHEWLCAYHKLNFAVLSLIFALCTETALIKLFVCWFPWKAFCPKQQHWLIQWHSIILERDYLFFWPMADWESVLQTCLNKKNEWICESMELHIPVNVSRMTLIYPWHKEKQLKHDITIYHFRIKCFQEKSWTNCSHKPHCAPKCWPSSVLVTQCQASWENLSQTQHILCSCLMIMNECMNVWLRGHTVFN